MSYLDLLNEFNRWLESNALPASAQLMYFKLLNVFNKAGWPASVRVDNHRLMSMTMLSSANAVIAARSRLVEAGIIGYEQGKKGMPGRYTLRIPYDNHNVSDNVSCDHIKTKTKEKEYTPISPLKSQDRFVPPTLEEVAEYCAERNNSVDAQTFVDFYASKGWYVGKNLMKDWKAAVRTWERNRSPSLQPKAVNSYDPYAHFKWD